jgi:hypothetical protein
MKPLHIHTRAQNHPDKQKSHKSRYMSRRGGCSPALAATRNIFRKFFLLLARIHINMRTITKDIIQNVCYIDLYLLNFAVFQIINIYFLKMRKIFNPVSNKGEPRCPSRFGPPSKWTPRSKSASEYGPGSPYPLANMDLYGDLYSLADLDSPSEFGPLAYFIIATYRILNIVLKAF